MRVSRQRKGALALSVDSMAGSGGPEPTPAQTPGTPAPSFASALGSLRPTVTTPAPAQSKLPLSPQQSAVVEWVRTGTGHAFVGARAGSGKTHTLIAAAREMVGSVAYAAFNKKISEEVKHKLATTSVRVGTFHSFGFSAWRRVAPHVKVEAAQKDRGMMVAAQVPKPLQSAVRRLVSLAKQSVVGKVWQITDRGYWMDMIDHHSVLLAAPATGDDNSMASDLIAYAARGLHYARENGSRLIDFDDMLWLPIIEDVATYQNDWVLVDECQDTNLARRLMAEKMVKRAGRTLWVGDVAQSIYGFAGADADAVSQIVSHFHCQHLPLTVTFRCSKAATALAQRYVPDIVAHESNREGSVVRVPADKFLDEYVRGQGIRRGDAILCRNTRPLVDLAFRLIRAGVGCHVEGRDVGNQLMNLATRWSVATTRELVAKLHEYQFKESERLMARDAGHLLDALNDRVETLMILCDGVDTVEELRGKIESLFQDTDARGGANRVTLSTIHRFKGRESDRVFILGWGKYMPSKMAHKQWEKEQESNLAYVAITRTRDQLLLVEAIDE